MGWAIKRLNEPSTWAGAAVLMAIASGGAFGGMIEAAEVAGMLASLGAMVLPEKRGE